MPYKLLSSEDIKQITRGELGSDFDALFESIVIPAVCELIARRTGWIDFDLATRTLYFSPTTGQKILCLPFANIKDTPAPQIFQDTSRPPSYSTPLVLDQDYTINRRLGIIVVPQGLCGGDRSLKVVMRAGYLTGDGIGTPSDLRLGAMFAAKMIFDRRDSIGLTSRSLEGGAMSFLSPLLRSKDVWDWFHAYKLFPDAYDM